MVIKHSILCLLVAFSLGRTTQAVPMSVLIEPSPPEYYKAVLTRLISWYETKTNKPFIKSLKPSEQKYINFCLNHITAWGYQTSSMVFWNYLRLTAQQSNGSLKTRRIAIGPTEWSPEGRALASSILLDRKIKIRKGKSINDILWLEWDLDNQVFAVYYKEMKDNVANLLPHPENYSDHVLVGEFYSAKDRFEKTYASRTTIDTGLLKIPFYPLIMQSVDVIVDGKVEAHILELRSFSDQWMEDPLKKLANGIFDEFRILADSMNFKSPSDLELYYP